MSAGQKRDYERDYIEALAVVAALRGLTKAHTLARLDADRTLLDAPEHVRRELDSRGYTLPQPQESAG